MKTRFVEATQNIAEGFNHGKFMVGVFNDDEWIRRCELDYQVSLQTRSPHRHTSLLPRCGWTTRHIFVFDLQTGEGALFLPGGSAHADLEKHRVWVCPMFEPFLEWLYKYIAENPDDWFTKLNTGTLIELDESPAFAGYRRGE